MKTEKLNPTQVEIQTNELLNAVQERRPVLKRLIQQYGDFTLQRYAKTFPENNSEPIQPREEVAQVAGKYTERLLGTALARKVEQRLVEKPVILTANHHGPDFLNITTQGNILMAFGESNNSVLPVFACANVPLDNLAFGKGVILSREYTVQVGVDKVSGQPVYRETQVKVPLFPNKESHTLVHVAPALKKGHIENGVKKITEFSQQNVIGEQEKLTLLSLMHDVYQDEEVLRQLDYSDQSTIINARLWKRYFAENIRDMIPDIAFLNIEKITGDLLESDLRNPNSLMHNLLFENKTRSRVLEALNGIYGCWDLDKLKGESALELDKDKKKKVIQGGGTTFFWAIDNNGKRIPMSITKDGLYLKSPEDENNVITITPESILERLRTKQLMPGLFVNFSTIAFARGFKCYGGFMQTDYLTNMRNGLASALEASGHETWSKQVVTVPTENYSTGMSFIVARYEDGSVKPTGGVEIMTKGGLTQEDLQKIQVLRVKDANLLGLPGMYPVVVRESERNKDLTALSEDDIYRAIGNKLVEIPIR